MCMCMFICIVCMYVYVCVYCMDFRICIRNSRALSLSLSPRLSLSFSLSLSLSSLSAGQYHIPSYISRDARNLISRMLVVPPMERITIAQIWLVCMCMRMCMYVCVFVHEIMLTNCMCMYVCVYVYRVCVCQ